MLIVKALVWNVALNDVCRPCKNILELLIYSQI